MGLLARDIRCPKCGGVLIDVNDYELDPDFNKKHGITEILVSATCIKRHYVMIRWINGRSVKLTVEAN